MFYVIAALPGKNAGRTLVNLGTLDNKVDGWRFSSYLQRTSSRKGHLWAAKALPKNLRGAYLADADHPSTAVALIQDYRDGTTGAADAHCAGRIFTIMDGKIARTSQALDAGLFPKRKGAE